jgi:hypothetical protein
MSIEKVVPYPGVDEADAVNVETDKLQEKRRKLWSKREDKREREEDRSIEKELKQLDYEEKHPSRVRIKKRLRTAEKGVRKQVGNAWRHTEGVAKDVAMYRKANPPRVIPRPRGMRMAPGPSQRSSNMNQGEVISSSVERDFFGSQQQPGQEKDFFGPPKLLDLIGGSNAPKKEVDYIGNKKKKETRYY